MTRRHRPMNLSSTAFRNLAAALGLAVLSTAAQAEWTLQTAAGGDALANLTVNTWTSAEGLSATDKSGKLVRFQTRDLVSLAANRKVNPELRQSRWKLSLRNGDTLYGEPGGFSGQSFTFRVPEIGALHIPLKSVATLSNAKTETRAAGSLAGVDKDVVRLANGDTQDGILANIEASRLQLAVEGVETEIPLERVASIHFGGAAAPRGVPPLSLRLTFLTGTTFTLPVAPLPPPSTPGQGAATGTGTFNWTLNKVVFQDPAATQHTVAPDSLVSIEVLGGRAVYLTELDPASEEQVSLLGTRWPMQTNRNVLGGPLRVARNEFARGIGVHTRSTLVYALDGTFETLSLQVGLDDSAAPHGEAVASILLDGKTLWKSEILKPGELSPILNLPISGGKRLELVAAPAARLDVLGRVNWLNPALRRK